MAVTVECNHCHKTYRVDAKVTGKKVRCKNCGQIFLAVLPDSGPSSDGDLYAGLAQAAAVERQYSPAVAIAAMYDDAPAAEVPVDAPACPSCRASLPLDQAVCLNCGFNRRTGQHIAATPASPAKRKNQGPAAARSALTPRATRPNLVSEFGPIAVLQDSLPALCALGLAIVILWSLVDGYRAVNASFVALDQLLAGGAHLRAGFEYPSKTMAYLKMTGGAALGTVLLCGGLAGVSMLGVYLTSRILKFDMPDSPMLRMNGVIGAGIVPLKVVLFIATLNATAARPNVEAIGLLAVLVILLSLFLSFFTVWAFFRLRFLEALLAYFFASLFGGAYMGLLIAILVAFGIAITRL